MTKVDLDYYVQELEHLTKDEKVKLLNVLQKFPQLFGGGLGTLNIKPIHMELKKDVTPYSSIAFPIPQSLEKTHRKEVDRLTKIDVLEPNSDSEWAAPTFVQPKKTGDVRLLTDFRELNKRIKRKPFPLPKISELLQRLRGFRWATAIDLSMGYYHIPLDKFTQKPVSYTHLTLPTKA